jgi:hypothetical protein
MPRKLQPNLPGLPEPRAQVFVHFAVHYAIDVYAPMAHTLP